MLLSSSVTAKTIVSDANLLNFDPKEDTRKGIQVRGSMSVIEIVLQNLFSMIIVILRKIGKILHQNQNFSIFFKRYKSLSFGKS